MCGNRSTAAFTLIEVLIVVVIMAVLAAIVIPKINAPIDDARQSTLSHNLHTLRAQIGMYRINHLNRYPTIQNDSLPQLTRATNSQGQEGPPGLDYPYGPYVVIIPRNPYDDSDKVSSVSAPGVEPTAISGGLGGWQYDATTGGIWPNNPRYFQ